MSIIVSEKTPVIVQGFTGRMGTFHAEEMIEYGTNVVGGIAPGKSGSDHLGLPVFDTVRDAVNDTGAEASIVFVPPPFAADAIMEAVDAGISYCVCITDGIPAQDMMKVKRYMRTKRVEKRMTLMGPNCAGVISPGKALLGIMPGHIYAQGPVGIVGRSGTLGYEAASQLKAVGIGVSTSVGIGGDPINGSSFTDHLKAFEQDPETSLVCIIGEIGGPQEAEAAAFAKDHMHKKVVAYIAGLSAPKGRTMGHAGAIVAGAGESAVEKIEIMRDHGVNVVERPSDFGTVIAKLL
ncbi:MAG: succinate--CoA ligase subunit alpha [Actinomycetota bacterium]|nr:succinate--CoA ligase subunit alpha [Actinomycetota bacterium]MED5221350.1 succinate--CoA ligase subunit alpha [Actinomycetota bacterium]MED5232548.1 succinate--CoA ligase subunit alpha [Actinomycetota bacterium]MEE3353466.1 succinate--CoA ligase subunit alpha [Actinomycetota bacterium]